MKEIYRIEGSDGKLVLLLLYLFVKSWSTRSCYGQCVGLKIGQSIAGVSLLLGL